MTRAELGAFLDQLSSRTKSMRDHKIEEICRSLAKVNWMVHITDDVYRCCVCFAQDRHTPECLAAKVVKEHGDAKDQEQ